MMHCRVAIAQIDSRLGDLRWNLEHHISFVRRAMKEKADVVVFPELSLTGYSLKDLSWNVAQEPQASVAFADLKKLSKSISIAAGFVENGPGYGIYNSGMFLEDGVVKHIHRKLYPPTYGMFEEGRYFSSGVEVKAFDSKFGRFGMLICEDMWHVSLPYLLALGGAEVLLSLTASPTRMAGEGKDLDNKVVNHEHMRAYARLLSTYTVFSNRVGFEDGVNFWGGSVVVAPSGDPVVEARLYEEDLVVGDLDSSEVRRARRFSRHVLDERPEILLQNLQRTLRP